MRHPSFRHRTCGRWYLYHVHAKMRFVRRDAQDAGSIVRVGATELGSDARSRNLAAHETMSPLRGKQTSARALFSNATCNLLTLLIVRWYCMYSSTYFLYCCCTAVALEYRTRYVALRGLPVLVLLIGAYSSCGRYQIPAEKIHRDKCELTKTWQGSYSSE